MFTYFLKVVGTEYSYKNVIQAYLREKKYTPTNFQLLNMAVMLVEFLAINLHRCQGLFLYMKYLH
jgi:hypothetical protein